MFLYEELLAGLKKESCGVVCGREGFVVDRHWRRVKVELGLISES